MAFKQLKLWFDKDLAILLADKISIHEVNFNQSEFIEKIDLGVAKLELKDRVEWIADALNTYLPGTYQNKIETLEEILGPENEEETGMFNNFYWIMPIAKFVEKYGLEDFDTSIKMIAHITKRNTGEYAIRPFIKKYPIKTIETLLQWSSNSNRHVRRLASEGPRPRLPWASKLETFIIDPSPIMPILENLKDDTSKYVQKSVANCLNDILKDNSDQFKKVINNWQKNATKERKWIIKHALRNLIKKEDSWALGIVEKINTK